jgi:hypothetical protein
MEPESDRLLADVLAESAPADFRAQLLDLTLQNVRRRKRARYLRQGLFAVAVIVVFGVLALRNHSPAKTPARPPLETLAIVNSQPLSPAMIIATRPGALAQTTSSASEVSVVATSPLQPGFREINDTELMAMTGGRPAVLVRQGPQAAELFIIDSASQTVALAESFQH